MNIPWALEKSMLYAFEMSVTVVFRSFVVLFTYLLALSVTERDRCSYVVV